jgi:hypothetical protein
MGGSVVAVGVFVNVVGHEFTQSYIGSDLPLPR